MSSFLKLLIAGMLFASAGMGYAATNYYVWRDNPSPQPPFTNWAIAANSIQDAVDRTIDGDTVIVTNGLYDNGGALDPFGHSIITNRVMMANKAITVRSANNNPTNTIIKGRFDTGEPGGSGTITNGPSAIRGVYCWNDNARLIGFTVTNGATAAYSAAGGHSYYGGGVWAAGLGNGDGQGMLTSNCVMTVNGAGNAGGGSYGGKFYNCTFSGNSADGIAAGYGGGGAIYGKLFNCTLINNYSKYQGGGTYAGTATNCTYMYNQAIGLYGGGGAYGTPMDNCTLISNGATDYSTIYGGGASFSTLSNCTLTANYAQQGAGTYGGTLYNCTLSNNYGYYGGGANGSILYNCTLTRNQGSYGGAGGGANGGTLYNCTLTANYGGNGGGGAINATLYNCTLSGNYVYSGIQPYQGQGGGAYGGTLYNCTLNNNDASTYPSQRGGGAWGSKLINCIVYFNTASAGGSNWDSTDPDIRFTNSCTAPDANGVGAQNITGDPLFITNGISYDGSYVAGNYRLQANSPCINAGMNQDWMTNAVDLDGRIRIRYGTVDIGAYECIYRGAIYTVR